MELEAVGGALEGGISQVLVARKRVRILMMATAERLVRNQEDESAPLRQRRAKRTSMAAPRGW